MKVELCRIMHEKVDFDGIYKMGVSFVLAYVHRKLVAIGK